MFCGMDQWESRIERLIQDWHLGSDMLFSIHPVDGSFLMWQVFCLCVTLFTGGLMFALSQGVHGFKLSPSDTV